MLNLFLKFSMHVTLGNSWGGTFGIKGVLAFWFNKSCFSMDLAWYLFLNYPWESLGTSEWFFFTIYFGTFDHSEWTVSLLNRIFGLYIAVRTERDSSRFGKICWQGCPSQVDWRKTRSVLCFIDMPIELICFKW